MTSAHVAFNTNANTLEWSVQAQNDKRAHFQQQFFYRMEDIELMLRNMFNERMLTMHIYQTEMQCTAQLCKFENVLVYIIWIFARPHVCIPGLCVDPLCPFRTRAVALDPTDPKLLKFEKQAGARQPTYKVIKVCYMCLRHGSVHWCDTYCTNAVNNSGSHDDFTCPVSGMMTRTSRIDTSTHTTTYRSFFSKQNQESARIGSNNTSAFILEEEVFRALRNLLSIMRIGSAETVVLGNCGMYPMCTSVPVERNATRDTIEARIDQIAMNQNCRNQQNTKKGVQRRRGNTKTLTVPDISEIPNVSLYITCARNLIEHCFTQSRLCAYVVLAIALSGPKHIISQILMHNYLQCVALREAERLSDPLAPPFPPPFTGMNQRSALSIRKNIGAFMPTFHMRLPLKMLRSFCEDVFISYALDVLEMIDKSERWNSHFSKVTNTPNVLRLTAIIYMTVTGYYIGNSTDQIEIIPKSRLSTTLLTRQESIIELLPQSRKIREFTTLLKRAAMSISCTEPDICTFKHIRSIDERFVIWFQTNGGQI